MVDREALSWWLLSTCVANGDERWPEMSSGSFSVLVIGSLGPNPERIRDFRSLGHQVTYVHTQFLPSISTIDREVECIAAPHGDIGNVVARLIFERDIDVVYSLLNAHDGSTEATLELLDNTVDVSVIRHYKEHPCVPTHEEGRILRETDAQIYINEESRDYFRHMYGVTTSAENLPEPTIEADRITSHCAGNPRAKRELSEIRVSRHAKE